MFMLAGHFLYMMLRFDFLHDDFSNAVQTFFVRWRGYGRLVTGKSNTGSTEMCFKEKSISLNSSMSLRGSMSFGALVESARSADDVANGP